MSQQQESSLPKLRELARTAGYHEAIKQAAAWIDEVTDELGRRRDFDFVVRLGWMGWGFAVGVAVGWFL